MEEKIINTLISIGMGKNEITVYLDLLSFGTSSASRISKRTQLHRANVYDILKKLSQKGFISEILDEDKRFFKALGIEKIKIYLKQKEDELDEIEPLIKTLQRKDEQNEEVILAKGLFSLRNNLLTSLDKSKSIEMYGLPQNFIEILGEGFFREFNKKRIRKKIPLKLIFKQKPEKIDFFNGISLMDFRFSGLSYASLTIISIFDEEIMMILPVNPFSIITVKGKDLAETYREYFKILWENSKE